MKIYFLLIALFCMSMIECQQEGSFSMVRLAGSNFTEISSIYAKPITTNTRILASDSVNGDIYIYDMGMIRKLDISSRILNVAGTPRLSDIGFVEYMYDIYALNSYIGGVTSLTVDPTLKHVYFIDLGDGFIKQINSLTRILTKVIGGNDPQSTIGVNFQLSNPKSLTVSQDGLSLYFLDDTTVWRYGTTDYRVESYIQSVPSGCSKILLSPDESFIYMLDSNKIHKYENKKNAIDALVAVSLVDTIQDFVVYSNFVYFLSNQTLQVFDGAGVKIISGATGIQSYKGDGGAASNALYNNPTYLAVNYRNEIYIMDSDNVRIRKVTTTPSIVKTIIDPNPTTPPITTSEVSIGEITDMSFDTNFQILYICDKQEKQIRIYDGNTVNTLYSGIDCDGIAVNSQNELFISVKDDNKVYLIRSINDRSEIAGTGVPGYLINGPAISSTISKPTKLRFLQNDNLLIVLEREIAIIDSATLMISKFTTQDANFNNIFTDLNTGYVYYGDSFTIYRKTLLGSPELMAGIEPAPARSILSGDNAIGYELTNVDGIAVTPDGMLYISMKDKIMYVKDGLIYKLKFVDSMSDVLAVSQISRPRVYAVNLFSGKYGVYMTNAQNNIYFLSQESSFSCFGISPNSSTVCSGRGICENTNICTCQSGFYGLDCKYGTCFGIPGIQNQLVCNSKGSCFDTNNCTCTAGLTGQCLTPICYGLSANDSSVCSGRGSCIQPDTCQCNSEYNGTKCEISTCFGIRSNETSVCSGSGECVALDTCQCRSGFTGSNCSFFTCFGKGNNDPQVCSGRGSCYGPDDCRCNSNYTGSQCENFNCFGVYNNQSHVCSGNGKCQNVDSCQCNIGYYGSNCENSTCYNLPQSDPMVCSGHGSCIRYNFCNCKNESGFIGTNCSIPLCFGFAANETQVCSGNGKCNQPNTCQCNSGTFGNNCKSSYCIPQWSEEFQNMTCVKPSSIVNNAMNFAIIETLSIIEMVVSKVVSFAQVLTSVKFPSNFYQYLMTQGLVSNSNITIVSSVYNTPIDTSSIEIQLLSPIVSISILNDNFEETSVKNLENPIEISFSELKVYKTDANVTCMYYDTMNKEWKTEGMKTIIISSTTSSTENFVKFSINCQTNHLTSFGIIDSNYKKAVNNRQDTTVDMNKLGTGEIIAIAVSLGGSALILLVIGVVVAIIVGIYLKTRRKQTRK